MGGFPQPPGLPGLTGILDAITDGTLDDIDPERYEDIPERTFLPRD